MTPISPCVSRAALTLLVALASTRQLFAGQVYHDTAGPRLDMERYGRFVPRRFSRSSAPEITSDKVKDAIDCSTNCLKSRPMCYSFNLGVTPDVNGKLLCQLLAADRYNSSENLEASQDFHFYGNAGSRCAESPCQHGRKCYSVYESNQYFICVCDTDKGWHQHENACYKMFSEKKTWDEAKTSCEGLGASLLTIHSAEENAFVNETLLAPSSLESMLALRDFGKNGSFAWADNSTVDYTNWYPGEPNNLGHEDCAYMQNVGTWNNVVCSRTNSYICEK